MSTPSTARAPRLLLAPGASGTAAGMRRHVEGLCRRGIDAAAIDVPKGNATRAAQRFLEIGGADIGTMVLGGHSYGGRAASMVAADHPVGALVLLSYPLHRPGHPEELRTEHWPRISCPVLLLSGEADPFARIDLLHDAIRALRDATLVTYPRVRHGLDPVLDDALDRIAEFLL